MKDSELDGAMERAIDRALESYTAGEPEPDLAERIVAAAKAMRRSRRLSGVTRAWTLAAAAALACVAMVTVWMKSEHLEIAVVHTNVARPAAQRQMAPQRASAETRAAVSGETHAAVRTAGARDTKAATKQRAESGVGAGDEQLAAEGVGPIVFKPIVMAPIRMEAPGQESQ